jgi:hypothetical protein
VYALRQAAYAASSIQLAPLFGIPVCTAAVRSDEAKQGHNPRWDR